MPKKKQFPLVHFDHLQYPTIAIIGRLPYLLYVLLRRWSTPTVTGHNSARVRGLREKGRIVAWLDHDRAGVYLGTSRQEVGRHLKRLEQFGWIRSVKIENNRRAYKLGFFSNKNGHPVLYADQICARLKPIVGTKKLSSKEWREALPEIEKNLLRLGKRQHVRR